MARTKRFAMWMLPLLVLSGCGFAEQQKDLLARMAAFCVLRPVLQLQSSQATLTQGTVRQAEAVAPKQLPTVRTAPSTQEVAVAAARPAVQVKWQDLRLEAEVHALAHAAARQQWVAQAKKAECHAAKLRKQVELRKRIVLHQGPSGTAIDVLASPIGG